jgi:hypothetical protein
MTEEERYDGLFMNVAQSARGIEPLLEQLFSFLRRKTDFYSGASKEQIETIVLNAVRKQQTLADDAAELKRKEKVKQELAKKKKEEKAKAEAAAAAAAAKTANNEEDVVELGTDGSFDTSADGNPAAPPAEASAATPQVVDEKGAEDADDTGPDCPDEDDVPPPPGNGGSTDKYVWTQSLSELGISIFLPEGTRARDLKVDFDNQTLKVAIKGKTELIVDGTFHKRIIVDDTLWTIEDGALKLDIAKEDKMCWWKCALVGDPEINTQKVQPENSKLGDLDGETRQTVEKMMFDQRQKAMGLPSADELQKQEMLQKFMTAHPEMDFSKAKMG